MQRLYHSLSMTALLLAVAPATAKVPMTLYLDLPRTDMAMAGLGGIGAPGVAGGGAGTLELSGVSGNVSLALLYWHGIDIEDPAHGYTGGDGDYDQPDIVFNGTPVNGTRLAHLNHDNGWPANPGPGSAALYRADVTALVQTQGNGSYSVADLAAKPGHSANGISLIVYFDDGNAANDLRVQHFDGLQSNFEPPKNTPDWVFDFEVDYLGGPVELWLHVADGQTSLADGTLNFAFVHDIPGAIINQRLTFSSPLYDGKALWGDESVPTESFPRPTSGEVLWDIRRFPLTGGLGKNGHYQVTTKYESGQDAVALMVAQVVQAVEPAEPLLGPTPYDFGDVLEDSTSAPARFTLRNQLPHDLIVLGAPNVGTVWHSVVGDTCTGATLTPNESCYVDVVCTPSSTVVSYHGLLQLNWKDAPFYSDTRTSYAALRCAGVPPTPFSRLEFDPPFEHDFGKIIAGHPSTPWPVEVRNTGELALTLTELGVDAGFYDPDFELTSNDCGTQTLQPGAHCNLAVRFMPPLNNTQIRKARLYALYSASDTANGARGLQLSGQGIPDPSAIFRDGFE